MYAVISDIHANLEAAEAVLEDILNKDITEIYCLGDIVGYGPNPDECCNLARKYCKEIVIGNHDADLVQIFLKQLRNSGRSLRKWFKQKINPVDTARKFKGLLRGCAHPWAYNALIQHEKMLKDKNKRWLANLPIEIDKDKTLFRHNSPGAELYDLKREERKREPARFAGYIIHPGDYFEEEHETKRTSDTEHTLLKGRNQGPAYYALFAMQYQGIDLAMMGHNHVASYIAQKKEDKIKRDDKYITIIKHNMKKKPDLDSKETYELELDPDFMYILNPGSVGQPRDRDPRASYMTVHDETIMWHKIPYSIKKTMKKINEIEPISMFGNRLCSGI